MKDKLKIILKAVVLLTIAIWVLDKLPFEEKINQQISAEIYQNGTVIGVTKITMEGTKTNYLFGEEESFHGRFFIPLLEKTGREGMTASISWRADDNFQEILYYGYGNSYSFEKIGMVSYFMINESMDSFVLMLTDGTVIATSEELASFYTKHVTYHGGGMVTIGGADTIPKFD